MVAQAAGVNARRHEIVAERVHLHDRRVAGRIAVVVGIDALGQRRAGGRFDRHHAQILRLRIAGRLVGQEREGDAAEVGAAAAGRENHVGVLANFGQLLLRFQADDGLMQQHVVKHGSQCVIRVGAAGRLFHRLGDGQAERALIVRVLGQRIAPGIRHVARAGKNFRTPGLHHRAAERLLVVADLDHVNAYGDAEHLAGKRQRTAPLASAGFRCQPHDAGLLVVESLRHRRVRLVRTRGRHRFILVEDFCRRTERLLQPMGAIERRWPPQAIGFTHFLGNGDPALGRHFLLQDGARKDRQQRLRRHRLAVRTQRWRRGIGHVGDNVVPVRRNVVFFEQDLGRTGHVLLPLIVDWQSRLRYCFSRVGQALGYRAN